MALNVSTSTMMSPARYKSYSMDHLGLVAAMYDELGIGRLIDQLIPQDEEKRTLSIGQLVKAMVINGLGFTQRALYLMPKFFADKPVERLIGEGVKAEDINDDALGRALDKIFAYGVTTLFNMIALQVIKVLGISPNRFHLDTTSFHVDGDYNSKDSEINAGVVRITPGYSRDHRPSLNQIILQLIVENQAGIPLLMKPLDGNSNDKENFKETIKNHIEQLIDDHQMKCIVADSALYTAETLPLLESTNWISRVPDTIGLAQELKNEIGPELRNHSKNIVCRGVGVVYANVRQRWLIVWSSEAYESSINAYNDKMGKETEKRAKEFERLCQKKFESAELARQSLETFKEKLTCDFVSESSVIEIKTLKNKSEKVYYQVTGNMAVDLHLRENQLRSKGCFIVATNQLNCEELTDEQLLPYYKDQQKVERSFRFLKDPMFMASTLFLKSVERIMSLMMIMTLCLTVYAALEYRIRGVLKKEEANFPDQKGKRTSKPTARWVFQYFSGIHLLVVMQMQQMILNLNQYHAELLRLLGQDYTNIYSNSG